MVLQAITGMDIFSFQNAGYMEPPGQSSDLCPRHTEYDSIRSGKKGADDGLI